MRDTERRLKDYYYGPSPRHLPNWAESRLPWQEFDLLLQ